MKTRNKVSCQGTNGRSVWLQWIMDQFRRHDCTRETLVSIEYADADDPGWEPKPKREPVLKWYRSCEGQVAASLDDLAKFEIKYDGDCKWTLRHFTSCDAITTGTLQHCLEAAERHAESEVSDE